MGRSGAVFPSIRTIPKGKTTEISVPSQPSIRFFPQHARNWPFFRASEILKYCTGSSARSYQCKFAVDQVFHNKSIESLEEVGAAIKEIIHFKTIRGKFSSVHPDLAAEGITRVEVGEEGPHFVTKRGKG